MAWCRRVTNALLLGDGRFVVGSIELERSDASPRIPRFAVSAHMTPDDGADSGHAFDARGVACKATAGNGRGRFPKPGVGGSNPPPGACLRAGSPSTAMAAGRCAGKLSRSSRCARSMNSCVPASPLALGFWSPHCPNCRPASPPASRRPSDPGRWSRSRGAGRRPDPEGRSPPVRPVARAPARSLSTSRLCASPSRATCTGSDRCRPAGASDRDPRSRTRVSGS
jgi:hypothetical protein